MGEVELKQGWQPIESAPKDGTAILGAAKDREVWAQTTVRWENDGDGYWGLVEIGANAEDSEWWPTHWLPLPEPPAKP
jgi:hypothetical protein